MREFGVLICACLAAAGCAGREPAPISAGMPTDAEMSCQTIDSEIRGNNDAIRTRVNEDADVENKNIAVGATAALLFFPLAFAMDLKGAALTEANAFEQRNRTLTGLSATRRCSATRAVTVAEATQEREAVQAAARAAESDVDALGVKNPSDQRVHQPAVAAPLAASTSVASSEPWRARGPVTMEAATVQAVAPVRPLDHTGLQELMDRFLRGEISKDEYERLRAG